MERARPVTIATPVNKPREAQSRSYWRHLMVKISLINILICSNININKQTHFEYDFWAKIKALYHGNVKIHTVAQIHTGVLSWPFIPYTPGVFKVWESEPPLREKNSAEPPPKNFFLKTCVLKAILIILHILNISDHNFKTFETYFLNIWNIFFKHIF